MHGCACAPPPSLEVARVQVGRLAAALAVGVWHPAVARGGAQHAARRAKVGAAPGGGIRGEPLGAWIGKKQGRSHPLASKQASKYT